MGQRRNQNSQILETTGTKKPWQRFTDLLHEFQDLFSTKFSKMKGILGDLGEMKIPLKPDAKPLKQQSYQQNPWYKKRVKFELNRMLDIEVI